MASLRMVDGLLVLAERVCGLQSTVNHADLVSLALSFDACNHCSIACAVCLSIGRRVAVLIN